MDTNEIDITGLDEAEVIAALHNGTQPLGMGMLHNIGRISVERVREEIKDAPRINGCLSFDYYHGRPLKVRVGEGKLHNAWLYDRDAGEGAAADIIAELRSRA